MKRKLICLLLIVFLFSLSVFAQDATVYINGEQLETPVPPQIVNDRTMLPMRAIFEALGATVQWFEEDKLIIAVKDDKTVTMKIGSYEIVYQSVLDGSVKIIELDVAPFIVNDGYTLVPVRAIAEALGANVEWVEETQQVLIVTK